ncbi:HpcH/HpaI aldolase/citrate lyase family protein [Geobacillus thermoleovorans]|mgnify:FL=1|jgi:citrate lyase subunit beta / citryl-CoA lyase|uniref:HpcH/HpaI aldolase/citrate lyase family protein n=1 Tax=Geobacillus thermoleovorans TaxID=33941 RepID=UPI003D1969FD
MFLSRTWMFVPGSQERRLQKVKDLPADVLIYDLEDAVAASEKEKARKMVRQALRENAEKVNFVRINDPSTPYFLADLQEIVAEGLAGIILPKAAKKEDVILVDRLLGQLEEGKNLPRGSIRIVPLIESALGLQHAYEIATASDRVIRLAFGSVDFTLDIGAKLTKEGTELLYARSQLVVASRAAGIEGPIDAVYIHIRDLEGLQQETRFAKQLGFQGKMVIHPEQIPIVNKIFMPTAEEVEEAKAIVDAFAEAVAAGSGAIQWNGKMIDYPVAERAKRIVAQAEILGMLTE